MPKFYIEVWASVGPGHDKEIVEVDQDAPPTEAQMYREYRDTINNILESGYCLVSKEDYDKYQGQ